MTVAGKSKETEQALERDSKPGLGIADAALIPWTFSHMSDKCTFYTGASVQLAVVPVVVIEPRFPTGCLRDHPTVELLLLKALASKLSEHFGLSSSHCAVRAIHDVAQFGNV